MSLPKVLSNLRTHPGMYVVPATRDTAVAFVAGYDAATGGGLLVGFREWLIVANNDGNNLAWSALVEQLAAKQGGADASEAAAITFVLTTLETFLAEREKHGGLRRIFARYESWLRQQDWYTPSSPQWIDTD